MSGWELRIRDVSGSFGESDTPTEWVRNVSYAHVQVDTVGELLEALHHIPLEAFIVGETSDSKISLYLFRTPCCDELGVEIKSWKEPPNGKPHPIES